MTYRQLSDADLQTYSHELARWREWTEWKDWARGYFGPEVAKLELRTEAEYNDEGGYDDVIRGHTAYDAEGSALDYDFSAPGWVDLHAGQVWHDGVFGRDGLQEAIERRRSDYLAMTPEERFAVWDKEIADWGQPDGLFDDMSVPEEHTLDFTVEPHRSWAAVYVLEGAA